MTAIGPMGARRGRENEAKVDSKSYECSAVIEFELYDNLNCPSPLDGCMRDMQSQRS